MPAAKVMQFEQISKFSPNYFVLSIKTLIFAKQTIMTSYG